MSILKAKIGKQAPKKCKFYKFVSECEIEIFDEIF